MSKSGERNYQNDLGEVWRCECGGINLSMGPLTLHFSSEEVPLLSELIATAANWVDASPTPGFEQVGHHIKGHKTSLH